MFCLPQYIETSAAEIFCRLRDENFLRSLERDAFIDRLAYYFGEVNAIHPFREGNGRTQRAFFEQLAYDAGFTLAWQHLDAGSRLRPLSPGWPGLPVPSLYSHMHQLAQAHGHWVARSRFPDVGRRH